MPNTASKPIHKNTMYDMMINPPYQIDFHTEETGKRVVATKKRVRFRFGFSNADSILNDNAKGVDARGSEHEIVFIWSLTSGKRLVLADGQEVHFSKCKPLSETKFECNWTMAGTNHELKLIAHASMPLFPYPGFRQYDLLLDGMSYFQMAKIYELGTNITSVIRSDMSAITTTTSQEEQQDYYNNYKLPPAHDEHTAITSDLISLEEPTAVSLSSSSSYTTAMTNEEEHQMVMPTTTVTNDVYPPHSSSSLSLTNTAYDNNTDSYNGIGFSNSSAFGASPSLSPPSSSVPYYDEFAPAPPSFDDKANAIMGAYNNNTYNNSPEQTIVNDNNEFALVPMTTNNIPNYYNDNIYGSTNTFTSRPEFCSPLGYENNTTTTGGTAPPPPVGSSISPMYTY